MIIFMFAVTFTQTVVDHLPNETDAQRAWKLSYYFGGVWTSMNTLYQAITGGVSWRECCTPLEQTSPMMGLIFSVYIAFTYFAVLNVVTGVFCSSALEATKSNPELVANQMSHNKAAYRERVKDLFKTMDNDDTNTITIDELEALLEQQEARLHLSAMGIVVEDAWSLFRLIDTDHGGTIDIDEFVAGCSRLSGEAKAMDIFNMQYEIHILANRLAKFMRSVEDRLGIEIEPAIELPPVLSKSFKC
jgi:Ca2+-binding EF-hand superfamily protein